MVMRFFSPRQQPQQARDPATGAIIPPLQNSFDNGIHYVSISHVMNHVKC